jgi:hypothetical protein
MNWEHSAVNHDFTGRRQASDNLVEARPCRHAPGDRWFADETYMEVAGKWTASTGPGTSNWR